MHRSLVRLSLRQRPPPIPRCWVVRCKSGVASGSQSTATVLSVLKSSLQGAPQLVLESEGVMTAMRQMVDHGVGSLVVKDASDRIVGFITQRDLLRTVVTRGTQPPGSSQREPVGWNVPVSSVMTASTELIFLRPNDTLEDARSLMAVSGKRHVPVLSGDTLLGIINPKDIARYLHGVSAESAKTDYVSRVMPRRGMPLGVRVHQTDECPFVLDSAVSNVRAPPVDTRHPLAPWHGSLAPARPGRACEARGPPSPQRR